MQETYAKRRERVKKALRANDLPALIVSHAANRYYLSGFELMDPQCNESAGMLVITASGPDFLMTDSRYVDQAKRLWNEDDIFVYSTNRYEAMGEFFKKNGLNTLGFESKSMCTFVHGKLSEQVVLTGTTNIVEELRKYKDEEEVRRMEDTASNNHQVFADIEKRLPDFIGKTEKDLAWAIEVAFRQSGCSHLAFEPIVAVNRNAALPHAIPGDTVITEDCLVLVDVGGRLGNYCSDQTRTFWAGENPSDRFLQTRDMVREAQEAALKILRPGLPIARAYHASREVFEKYKVAHLFTHALGHGIGLETHEPPSVSHVAVEPVFKPGMVVTVEPGLYEASWGGVRWEYMVLITEDGYKVL